MGYTTKTTKQKQSLSHDLLENSLQNVGLHIQ